MIVRGGLEYKINKIIDISAGYVYSEYYTPMKLTRLEHRPWEQVMVKKDFKKINLSLRYRLEHRFIKNSNESQYTFSTHRHRFQINALLPIWKKEEKQIGIILADEIFLNQGKSVNLFDQNRIISGVQYQWKKGNFVALTYQNMYQPKKVVDTYDNFDVLRIVIQQSFQFKKS